VRLTLGARRFDLTTRALVMGTLGAAAAWSDRAGELAAEGADLVEIHFGDEPPPAVATTVEALRVALGDEVPVAAALAGGPEAACAAVDAGAVLVSARMPGQAITHLLAACARKGAGVVVSAAGEDLNEVRAQLAARARQAEVAGIPPDRILVEPIISSGLLPHLQRFAELGYPLCLTLTAPVVEPLAAGHAAITALAVIRGCRLVRTDAVHAAVRVARVTAAILEAR
jgi:hypothetical protein